MMRRIWFAGLAGLLLAWSASAQSTTSTQTNASVQSKTSVKAGKSGAQAQSNTSVSASQQAGASRQPSGQSAGAQESASGSASASAQAEQGSASLSSGTTIEAVLTGSVDARKNKEGDQVFARTTQAVKSEGQVIIPKGSRLIGRVTRAQARAEGQSESALGIRFERAVLKNGREIPLNVAIQAVAMAQSAASGSLGEDDMTPSPGAMGSMAASGAGHASASGGVLGGVGSTVGGATGAVAQTAGTAVNATAGTGASATGSLTGTHAAGLLTSSSSGVIGLKGLSLNTEASNATQGSVIVSSTRNVHLDSGTRLLLRAQAQNQ